MNDCRVMSKAGIHLSQPEYTSGLVQVTVSLPATHGVYSFLGIYTYCTSNNWNGK